MSHMSFSGMRGTDFVARFGATMALKWARVYGAEQADEEEEERVIEQKVENNWQAFRRNTIGLLGLGELEESAKATEDELKPLL